MSDPISDALLQAYLDFLKEIEGMHRVLSELVPQSAQAEAQSLPILAVISQPELPESD